MPLPSIRLRKDEAIRIIKEQIDKGREIRENGTILFGDLKNAIGEERIWSDYNRAFVERAFGEKLAEEYDTCVPLDFSVGILETKEEAAFTNRIDARILWLRGILRQVPLMEEEKDVMGRQRSSLPRDQVFIIHGHDQGARDAVTLFVKNLGLLPIVLQSKPNEGLSIDRKLEKYSNVDFAIAILTPDDNGNPRPNVSLELGWFRRAIGNERVCILRKEGTNIPSDVGGVGNILMDAHGGWQQKVAKEIKAAGIQIDPDWYLKS